MVKSMISLKREFAGAVLALLKELIATSRDSKQLKIYVCISLIE